MIKYTIKKGRKKSDILNFSTIRNIASNIIMNPSISNFSRRIQSFEQNIRNTNSDTNVRPRKSLKNIRFCIKQFHFVDVVGLQKFHYFHGW